MTDSAQPNVREELSLFDSTCLILGIIVGVGVYQMAPDIARGAASAAGVFALWTLGGILSLCGALSYAELATTYPQEGGDYVYLNRAFGPWAGFLFGWIQLTVARPGDIAVMAFAFATYACAVVNPFQGEMAPFGPQILAAGAVLILTVVNIAGVRQGKTTQNLLTVFKVVGLLAVIAIAFTAPAATPSSLPPGEPLPWSLALIFVLFAFGGWNEMAYVAAEVRNPHRNIARALVVGTLAVTALYLLLNGAFLHVLGYTGLTRSEAVARDAVAAAFPTTGGTLISILIALSALGAVNGLVLTGARISYAMGTDHRIFCRLGRWHPRTGTPAAALAFQGALAIALILLLGSFVNAILYTAPAVYTFYLGTGIAAMILRKKDPQRLRPFRVPFYPLPPLLFCAVCAFLIYGSATYKPDIALAALGICLLGLPLYRIGQNRNAR